ncbi:amino acid adenylation domain-containing protein [Aquimarina sp. 2304DJ70-9]|uniref:amino acid adenylation domain-containing protein n=1 Tax=Aquimarina penaris TaxID=3231044 RepID=UPI0034617F6F
MKIDKYISDLRNHKGIIINVKDGELKIKASQDDLTPEIINEIKVRKSEIISFFESVSKEKELITPVEEQEHYAISHAQRRLWVIEQISGVEGLYNVPLTYSFDTIDIPSFRKAINALLERHEILRTTIHMIDGEPRQRVHAIKEFDYEVTYEKVNEDELDDIIEKEATSPFDLSMSSIRTTLVQSSDEKYTLILVLHHIVTDGWSTSVLLKDFLAFYDHYSTGVPLNLPKLGIQYKDYSHWQHEQLKLGKLNASKKYWHKKLSGELTALKLPLDAKRSMQKDQKGAGASFLIDSETVEKLTNLGNQHGASLFMVMTAIVKALLYRYTGQEDIIVGSPVSGRNHRELENQVGFYSNTVVLRSSIKGTYDIHQLLTEVSNVLLEAYEHQFYPYDILVDELSYDREMNRNPLFDVMVSLDNDIEEIDSIQDSNYTDEIATTDEGVSKFDITYAFLKLKDGSCKIDINYSTSLFEKEKIVRMASHLKNMILSIVENTNQKIDSIEYLSIEEKDQILRQFNDTEKENYIDASLKELIESNAKKNPNAKGIISFDEELTFNEVNVRANCLSNYLNQNYTVQKGDYIGVMMDESVDRMITLLSIIKLGAIYVPIDPSYPDERKEYIINDTQLNILITDELSELVYENLTVVNPKTVKHDIEKTAQKNPEVKINSEDIFAILYTSGSTGDPKGVMIKNKGIINRIQWLWDTYQFSNNDVIYQKTPIVFDVSIGELFMPLCFGAKLLIANSQSNIEIVDTIRKFGVTYVHFSPTMLNKFLEMEEEHIDKLSTIRFVFASGEELLKETVNRYYSKFKAPLINLYGPTEASIEVSIYETKPNDKIIPIGKPIANVNLYILDNGGKLLPVGVPGEIYIGGVCLAKGYLNQETKTNERFIHNPYHTDVNTKMYKTGDIGCWNSKGEIEFLGRKDNQIRIGGNRIEPGEIECKILEHPEVQEAAVVVNEDDHKNSHLVAYYVKRAKQTRATEPIENHYKHAGENIPKQKDVNESISQLTISEIFEKSVEKYFDDTALVYEGKTMSYAELNSKVNHLAYLLKSNYQIQNGDLVGIIMNRSEKLIITILAILKTGAAYVPIDAEYPESRMKQIVNDSSVNLLVLDIDNHNRCIDTSIPKLIYNATLNSNLNGEKALDKNYGTPRDLCYILYTSGSTGVPKGVMVEQYSVIDYVNTFKEYFELNNLDTVIQQSSISFDTSVEEIFPILCAGGKLVLFPEGGKDVDAMITSVNANKVTVVSSTPLVISELNHRMKEFTHYPRIIISGGDQLRDSHFNKIPESIRLYNTYGPTEATVCASFAQITKNTKCNVIGSPLKNHRIYLLDDQMKEVDHGTLGEIYIAGSGVARGYLNRDEETNQCFLSNVLGEDVLYKTGDMAKWNSDGLLEFYGRKDNQVKIRGYRVEPAEVDTVALLYKDVTNCYTVAKADPNGNKHLITYYISSIEIDNEQFRSFLKERLPHYMVSSYFMRVEHFPITTNGKINIKEFPVPYMLSMDRALNIELKEFLKSKLPIYMVPTQFRNVEKLPLTATGKVNRKELEKKNLSSENNPIIIKPVNSTENGLLKIWQSILNQSEISTDSNFFEMGGNSLKATQIVSATFKELGCTISLKDIYNNLSIIELSQFIENKHKDDSLIVKLKNTDKEYKNIFFIPPIIGSSTIFRDLATLIEGYNSFGLQYKGFDKETDLNSSIEEMAATFVPEILQVESSKTITLVAYSMGVPVAFEMSKILEEKSYDVKLIFIDRGVKENSTGEILNEESVTAQLETELAFWFNEVPSDDKERIKKLVFNNSKILDEYMVNGKIESDITTIEASQNINLAHMQEWDQYTYGTVSHSYIEANHYGILNAENLGTLSEMIIQEIEINTTCKELIQ